MIYKYKEFREQTININENEYDSCIFYLCTVIYNGKSVNARNCSFFNTEVILDDGATSDDFMNKVVPIAGDIHFISRELFETHRAVIQQNPFTLK